MSLLTIDDSKCKRDGICTKVCPRQLISQKTDDALPAIAPEKEVLCLACGQCVAVCPHGALNNRKAPLEDCLPLDKSLEVSWDQARQFLRSRRSIRAYKAQPLERATLQELIDNARYAPTGGNSQTVHWVVINGRDKLRQLSERTIAWMRQVVEQQSDPVLAGYYGPVVESWDTGHDSILRSAPALLIASSPGQNRNGLVDTSIALSYLELLALPLGLGTCWAGLLRGAMLNMEGMAMEMEVPEGNTWFYPMMIGYPQFKYQRLPERKKPSIVWV
ncbi:nitroreductase family protein [Desulfoferula mesophila]|uniref:Nitroreductase n=1 Tax=Desulfoferula mesophila TaxID=3058419 RepID=A0AAU9F1A5_9BACT|nr:nitroreductase [Desulfoferula mesophilus]